MSDPDVSSELGGISYSTEVDEHVESPADLDATMLYKIKER
jgi:hypothetical protein